MFFKMLVVTLVALVSTGSVAPVDTSVFQDPPEVVVLTLGDSISSTGEWQQEFCAQLEAATENTCVLRNAAVGATGCGYWPSRINALLTQHQPDLVIMACGTNDDTTTANGSENLGTAFRQVVEAVHTFQTPPIPFAPVLIQYSDPLLAPAWVLASQPITNDTLYINLMYYNPYGWFPGIVDWQIIPATADYLVGTPYPQELGTHPTARGYRYAGRLAYDRIAPGMGWPASTDPPLCGLHGHRRGYPRPAYTACAMEG